MAHEFPKDEDRRLHIERHGVVLERRPVAVPHEVIDEALAAGRVEAEILRRLEGLFPLRRHPRREQHV